MSGLVQRPLLVRHYLWALSSLSLTWISPSSCSSSGPSQGKVCSASSERTVSAGNLANTITQTCLLMLAHWAAPKFGTLARSMRRSVASSTPRELKAENLLLGFDRRTFHRGALEPEAARLKSPQVSAAIGSYLPVLVMVPSSCPNYLDSVPRLARGDENINH